MLKINRDGRERERERECWWPEVMTAVVTGDSVASDGRPMMEVGD
ncbi:uncharacterized protein G2W53_035170 [Senna tora]|uniref:Uncharacterized protein n=1 Tax=Senna tora TaxID=362788 RepID=A0A834SVC1_9FABA|nr:uncharacterized protein G2W53_035170 [Senna tora]